MRKLSSLLVLGTLLVGSIPLAADAAPTSEILYRLTRVRDSIWRYDYTLVNRATSHGTNSIVLFETYFPYGQTSNIGASLVQAANGWRAQTRDPFSHTADGVYQASARAPGNRLRAGQSLDGFAVEFEWLGGTPPAQQNYMAIHEFDRIAPTSRGLVVPPSRGLRVGVGEPTLSYQEHGISRLDPSVPEPSTIALFGSGVLAAALIARRRRAEARA